jgi:Xaa-Pro aminopeptidase
MGLDAMLLTSAGSLKAYADYWFNFEMGPSPFHALPAALFMVPYYERVLLMADDQQQLSSADEQNFTIDLYASYSYEQPPQFIDDFCRKLKLILGSFKGARKIGIEKRFLPAFALEYLVAAFPRHEWIDAGEAINLLRAVKDADEIEHIRKAALVADMGQLAVLRHATAGVSEIHLFNQVRQDMEVLAGCRVPIMADLVSGERTANAGGSPTDKLISKNDMILSDFTPCVRGYWGDSCNTVHIGIPDKAQLKTFALVKEALQIGLESLKPGIAANEVDARMRKHLSGAGNFGHHGGHGVGTAYHEHPRIVPYNTEPLKAGMVVALEPAVYRDDYGIRLEHLAVVRNNGPELLTKFTHQFTADA